MTVQAGAVPWRGVIEEYRSWLGLADGITSVTLQEGNTPLLPAPRLAESLGIAGAVYLKYEGVNPTGSFKDRGMTVAMSEARARGTRAVICASTGNTSASAAAYAARAGLPCFVIIPAGKIAPGKLRQAVVHGASVVEIEGNFDRALDIVTELGRDPTLTVVNSTNPWRLQGQKTAAFEICDALGRAPDWHVLPVGNAGNITAYWMGYREYAAAKVIAQGPRMVGVQAEGAAPLVHGTPVDAPDTVATAIRIGRPASWEGAVTARAESGGTFLSVSDADILAAQRELASTEGVFAEPASAASIAGLGALPEAARLSGQSIIVCTLTGHGLKDPAVAEPSGPSVISVPADVNAVREVLPL